MLKVVIWRIKLRFILLSAANKTFHNIIHLLISLFSDNRHHTNQIIFIPILKPLQSFLQQIMILRPGSHKHDVIGMI